MAQKRLWSVDSIVPGELLYPERPELTLFRFVSIDPNGPGAVRYFFFGSDALRGFRDAAPDAAPHYGRIYRIERGALRRLSDTRRAPADDPGVMSDNLVRDIDAEEEMRTRMTGYLADSGKKGGEPGRDMETRRTYRPGPPLKIVVFRVGQGDTILLELPDRELWLIDAYFGQRSQYDKFKDWFTERYGELALKRMVVSHYHYDHIKYAVKVIDEFNPEEVVVTNSRIHTTGTTDNLLRTSSEKDILTELTGVDDTQYGNADVRLIRTADFPGVNVDMLGDDPNDHAVAVCIKTATSRVLLSGDIHGHLLARLADDPFLKTAEDVKRFYKVTHHCSRTGIDAELFRLFPPNDAVTSCSKKNRYEHPHNPPLTNITQMTAALAGTHKITFKESKPIEYTIN